MNVAKDLDNAGFRECVGIRLAHRIFAQVKFIILAEGKNVMIDFVQVWEFDGSANRNGKNVGNEYFIDLLELCIVYWFCRSAGDILDVNDNVLRIRCRFRLRSGLTVQSAQPTKVFPRYGILYSDFSFYIAPINGGCSEGSKCK